MLLASPEAALSTPAVLLLQHHSGQQHLPDKLARRTYYVPGDLGYEERIREWLQRLREGQTGQDDK